MTHVLDIFKNGRIYIRYQCRNLSLKYKHIFITFQQIKKKMLYSNTDIPVKYETITRVPVTESQWQIVQSINADDKIPLRRNADELLDECGSSHEIWTHGRDQNSSNYSSIF